RSSRVRASVLRLRGREIEDRRRRLSGEPLLGLVPGPLAARDQEIPRGRAKVEPQDVGRLPRRQGRSERPHLLYALHPPSKSLPVYLIGTGDDVSGSLIELGGGFHDAEQVAVLLVVGSDPARGYPYGVARGRALADGGEGFVHDRSGLRFSDERGQ